MSPDTTETTGAYIIQNSHHIDFQKQKLAIKGCMEPRLLQKY